MAIPRRFDRRPPERDTTRINERIRVSEVRLIGDDGSQIGVMPTAEALKYAQERDLDLVEVAPESRPPVCRALDYSKYKYEQAQKAKATRKHQQQITVREIKLRPKIAQHDYETKRGHVIRFLKHQDKVKVTIMFRGREMAHPDRGADLLKRLAEDVHELGTIEQHPLQDGRNMTMVLGPVKQKVKQPEEGQSSDGAEVGAESGPAEPAVKTANSEPSEVPAEAAESSPVEVADSVPAEVPADVADSKPAEVPAEAAEPVVDVKDEAVPAS